MKADKTSRAVNEALNAFATIRELCELGMTGAYETGAMTCLSAIAALSAQAGAALDGAHGANHIGSFEEWHKHGEPSGGKGVSHG